ncbi:hypothetical protein C7974DRAFT_169376 [Boeremia exigua]|uniref:uncharacterized protein n=1 Tax=Boeremia exigua TaxID=749465 RepID=UPI001E8D6F1D|nr:uncharacterized protein C7974DRAFT_169376 [Boeremia exigua]KAH6633320.1 hypothetical protein C7974DRAFT_169376 [Boeremia exigua]
MITKQHSHRNDSTIFVIVACVFSAIGILFVITLLAHLLKWLFRRQAEDLEEGDLYHCFEDTRATYGTFTPAAHDSLLQDPDVRRMLRHERTRNNISGFYQISVRRLDEDEDSLSSDSSDSGDEGTFEYDRREETENEESSESESENSDSDEVNDRHVAKRQRRV